MPGSVDDPLDDNRAVTLGVEDQVFPMDGHADAVSVLLAQGVGSRLQRELFAVIPQPGHKRQRPPWILSGDPERDLIEIALGQR
jgi:hypothetical protein